MTYFRTFAPVNYKFGNEKTPDVFQNITLYADIVNQIKEQILLYDDYYIQDDERPDQVSMKLYGTPDYYWTFWLANPSIREFGWPLSPKGAYDLSVSRYKSIVLTTRTVLTDKFKIGQTVTGSTSGATATIDHRELDLGQVYLRNVTGTFNGTEQVTSTNGSSVETITLAAVSPQYNAARYYQNASKERVDIDPTTGPGAQITEVTWGEDLIAHNEKLRQIRIIRSGDVSEVASSFRRAVKLS
jgi:hypothetical protein